jgi:hypothetical protein
MDDFITQVGYDLIDLFRLDQLVIIFHRGPFQGQVDIGRIYALDFA